MKKNDLIPASVAIFVTLVLFILYKFNISDGKTAVVYVDNKIYGTYSLTENITETIPSYDGKGYLIIEIKDKKINVVESKCINKICVNSGKIDKAGQSLVCLPQKVVISVISDSETEYDGFTN